jgi:hypothetical protein
MALSGWSGSNRIELASPIVAGAPCTLACWFNSTSLTANQNLVALRNAANTCFIGISASGNRAGDPVLAYAGLPASAVAETATGYSANVWQHAAGVFASSSSRSAFLNGGNKVTNTISITPLTLTETNLAGFSSSASDRLSGALAEVGIWDVALTDDEIASLAKGVTPDQIRPQSLIAYLPLIRTAQDIKGTNWSTAGTLTVADHPRVYA